MKGSERQNQQKLQKKEKKQPLERKKEGKKVKRKKEVCLASNSQKQHSVIMHFFAVILYFVSCPGENNRRKH